MLRRVFLCETCLRNCGFCYDNLVDRKGFLTVKQLRNFSTQPLEEFIFSCRVCKGKVCELCAKKNISGDLICRPCEINALNCLGPEVYPSFVSSSCRRMCRILFLIAQRLRKTREPLSVLDKSIWRQIAVYAVGW